MRCSSRPRNWWPDMRVLLCTTDKIGSRIIRAVTWSRWSHAAIIDGDEIIEAGRVVGKSFLRGSGLPRTDHSLTIFGDEEDRSVFRDAAEGRWVRCLRRLGDGAGARGSGGSWARTGLCSWAWAWLRCGRSAHVQFPYLEGVTRRDCQSIIKG